MKKRFITISVVLVLIFILSRVALSTPLYITIEGRITDISYNEVILSADWSIDDNVRYVIMVDDDQTATKHFTNNDTGVTSLHTFNDNWYMNYGFAEFIVGDAFNEDYEFDPMIFCSYLSDAHYAYSIIDEQERMAVYIGTYVSLGSALSSLEIYQNYTSNDIFSPSVGQDYTVKYTTRDRKRGQGIIDAQAKIVSVSETSPVPEPPVVLLLVSGIAGLAVLRKSILHPHEG